jgi:hypothetical protein
MSGIMGFQLLVVIIMVVCAAVGLVGYYGEGNNNKG